MSDGKRQDDESVVEIDAIDEAEWEKDAQTPIVHDEQLSKLVKASSEDPAAKPARTGATVKRAPTANVVPAKTTAATVKRGAGAAKPTRTKPATGRSKPATGRSKPATAKAAGATAAPKATTAKQAAAKPAATTAAPKTATAKPATAKPAEMTTGPTAKPAPTSAADRSGALDPLKFTGVSAKEPVRVATKVDISRPVAGPRASHAAPSAPHTRAPTGKPPAPPPRSGATPPPLPARRSAPVPQPRASSSGSARLASGSASLPTPDAASRPAATPAAPAAGDEATAVAPPIVPTGELFPTNTGVDAATVVGRPLVDDDDLAVPIAKGEAAPALAASQPTATPSASSQPAAADAGGSEAIAALRAAGEISAWSAAGEIAEPTGPDANAAPTVADAAAPSAVLASPAAGHKADEPADVAASGGTAPTLAAGGVAAASVAAVRAGSTPSLSAEPGPNPFDEQVWRAEGGSDSEADAVGAQRAIDRRATGGGAVAFLKQRRKLVIVAGAAVLAIVAIGFAASGGSTSSSARDGANTAALAKPENLETTAEPTAGADDVAATDPAASDTAIAGATSDVTEATEPIEGVGEIASNADEGSATEPADDGATEPATERTAAHEPTRRSPGRATRTIKGKRVVLEYDSQAREAEPIVSGPKRDRAAISRARTSYAAGNTRLFAGDADGAIRNYRQALAYYPAYVAGYRGLGLAYAQKGDKVHAIRALRTYLSTVPHAKDAPLIRKRIRMLSR